MAKKQTQTYLAKPGYRSSPLQQLSSNRNWKLLTIKGSSGQLRHQILNSGMPGHLQSYWLGQLNTLEETLITTVDKKWVSDKNAFQMAVAKEAFDSTYAATKVEAPATQVKVAQEGPSVATLPIMPPAVKAKAIAKRSAITRAAEEF